MSGHSKWATIKHKKGLADAKRGQMFTKFIKEISIAARMGGGDPEMNPRLRTAILKAKAANMPKDTIDRAIKRGSGGGDDSNFEEVRYEGYGPGSVAIIIEGLTDNRNRTASEIRSAFTKNGGAMGETNSVSFMFDRVGAIRYPLATATADAMLEGAIEAGADNVESDEEAHEITCAPDSLAAVRDDLETRFGTPESARLEWKPQTLVAVNDEETARTLMKLLEILEDNDDVQRVQANFEIPDEIMERLGG